jgi:hypothetical protein
MTWGSTGEEGLAPDRVKAGAGVSKHEKPTGLIAEHRKQEGGGART